MSELPEGHSGYFSAPSHGLDPHLFDAEHLNPGVRAWIWDTLCDAISRDFGFSGVPRWLYAWIAGSGVTYQWAGDRGVTGDLDVLFGFDYTAFVLDNKEMSGIPEDELASYVNAGLKEKLWPKTAHKDLNGKVYEVTFFFNPGTEKDIRAIHPYAAYDLRKDKWAVRPPLSPGSAAPTYPEEWYSAADEDTRAATSIVATYTAATKKADVHDAAGARARQAALNQSFAQAHALFDDIHIGRREAFTDQGKGYSDYHNFRWQQAKATGVIAGLSKVIESAKAVKEENDRATYGAPVEAADVLLQRAVFQDRRI